MGSQCPPARALPQLDRPATLNDQVAVAQLPEQNQVVPQDTRCLAMGWGRLGTREPLPRVLQELNVTVVTFLCRPHNLCTFVPRRRAGICFVRVSRSVRGRLGGRPRAEGTGGGRAAGARIPSPPAGQQQAVLWSLHLDGGLTLCEGSGVGNGLSAHGRSRRMRRPQESVSGTLGNLDQSQGSRYTAGGP